MSREVISISVDSPVMEVIGNIEEHEIRLTPVLTAQGRYAGIVRIMEVADFLMSGGVARPVYQFEQRNFGKVLPGSHNLRRMIILQSSVSIKLLLGQIILRNFGILNLDSGFGSD